jgi:2,5-diketo-D-gluconate reductase A
MKNVILANGVEMPILGYGVYQIPNLVECEHCVKDAIEVGYRHIDTAQAYRNESAVGAAVKKSGLPRGDFFITTKIFPSNFGYEPAKAAIDASLKRLDTTYIDLLLLHQPFADYYGAYRALEEAYKAGKVRAIGVSNFSPDRLIDIGLFNEVFPMVNQVETHVFNQQIKAKTYMDKYHCQIESWGPFAEGRHDFFNNPTLVEVGEGYHQTAAQVALRYLIQRGIVVIPKSTHKERMEQNFAVFDFELNENDMAKILALDEGTSQFFDHTQPETVELFAKWIKG